MKTKRGKERQRVPAKEVQCTFCEKRLSIQGLQLHLRLKHPEQNKTTNELHEKIRRSHWRNLSLEKEKINAVDMEKLKALELEFGVYDHEKQRVGKKELIEELEALKARILSEKDVSKLQKEISDIQELIEMEPD